MQICPKYPTVHAVGELKQVMMIRPVDAEKNEAQHIGEKHRDAGT